MNERAIPIVWAIDVEPDAAVPTAAERQWTGFDHLVATIDRLRPQLEARTGAPVRIPWIVRMDPMIESIFGHADHVVREHAKSIDRLASVGDPIGLHVHPFRFDPERSLWYTDHTDVDWARHCIATAVVAYTAAFGCAPTFIRMGGYFLSGPATDAMVDHGLRVDLTSEPGRLAATSDASHGAYATEPSTDFTVFPRRRYRPSSADVSVPATTAADARSVTVVPLTSYDTHARLIPRHRALARRLIRRGPKYTPLNPWRDWPSAQWFWDCAANAAKQVGDDHLAFASRTLAADDVGAVNQDRVLEGLVHHPLAARLRFVDPLDLELDGDTTRTA